MMYKAVTNKNKWNGFVITMGVMISNVVVELFQESNWGTERERQDNKLRRINLFK